MIGDFNLFTNFPQSGKCQNALTDVSSSGAVFCGDIPNALFLKGGNGQYDNMDVDCDGADDKAGNCSNDPSGYGETAFKDTVQSYGIDDLNANIHPYVVVNEPPYFDAQAYGLRPLSVMAIVCNDQVVSSGKPSSFDETHRYGILTWYDILVLRRLGRHQHRAYYWRSFHLSGHSLLPR